MNIKGTINATNKYYCSVRLQRNYFQPLRVGTNPATLPEIIKLFKYIFSPALVYALYKFVQTGWHLKKLSISTHVSSYS